VRPMRTWVRVPHGTRDAPKHLTGTLPPVLFKQFPGMHYVIANVTLAQLVERKTFNLVVVGSNPTCDKFFLLKYIYYYSKYNE